MDGEAGNFVSKVDGDGLAVLNILAVHIELDAALAQVIDSAVNIVGQDGDVTMGAAEEEELTLEQAAQRAFALTIEGFSASAAAKAAAQGTAYSKSEVYKQLLLLQQTAE